MENFHKTLKSCFHSDACRLETPDRLKRFIGLMAILAYRVYYLTRISRVHPNLTCEQEFEKNEWKSLYLWLGEKVPTSAPNLKDFSKKVASLGGYLARNSDPPPGIIVMRRGLAKLSDISNCYQLFVGKR